MQGKERAKSREGGSLQTILKTNEKALLTWFFGQLEAGGFCCRNEYTSYSNFYVPDNSLPCQYAHIYILAAHLTCKYASLYALDKFLPCVKMMCVLPLLASFRNNCNSQEKKVITELSPLQLS